MKENFKHENCFGYIVLFIGILFWALIPAKVVSASDGYSDNIYFFSIPYSSSNIYDSDMILIESNGHYGLIDASNNSFTELNGVSLSPYSGLSDSVNNGLNNARFMIDYMGVDHLDFIVATHSHSDHIGGISEIANLEYNGVKLVDENTVYFYKDYTPINTREDDYWHNGDFFSLALGSMTENGALPISVNNGLDQAQADALYTVGALTDAGFSGGSGLGDFIYFQFGDFSIRLYNLYSAYPCSTENDNCIVTLITKGSQRILLLSDITNENDIGARLSGIISSHIGGARINLLKDAHHGTPYGSNTKVEAQNYRPIIDVSSKYWGASNPYNNFANFKYYCERYYGTEFYAAGDSDKAVAAVVSDNSIEIYNMTSVGSLTGMPVNNRIIGDGWQSWDAGRGYSWDPDGVGVKKWYYYKNHVPVTGWQKINNKWYWFENDGEMRTGWLKSGGKWYYLTDSGMVTGWQKVDGLWYYLDSSGAMLTGWQKLGGKWYYLKGSGAMAVGWEKVNGKWYYFNSSGAMTTGWQYVDGDWYYMEGSGAMLTGWRYINGYYYYLKPSGAMASNEYVSGYWLNKNGSWTYEYRASWRKNSTGWWYGDDSGWYAKNGTYLIDGVYYSFDSNGYLR